MANPNVEIDGEIQNWVGGHYFHIVDAEENAKDLWKTKRYQIIIIVDRATVNEVSDAVIW